MRHTLWLSGLLWAAAWAQAPVSTIEPTTRAFSDWPYYGGDAGGKKYSGLAQITRANVDTLEIVWTFRTGETGAGYASAHKMTFEATPVFWRGALYFTTGFNKAFAVDARTGRQKWRFDAGIPKDEHYAEVASRGVSLWHDAGLPADAACAHRVFFGTLTGFVHTLDAETGRPCTEFGEQGRVNMTVDVRPTEPGEYTITSPPAILGDTIIVGSAIGDNGGVELARGIVRALDARTGKVLWAWDPIPKDAADPAYSTWQPGSAERTGASNAWAPLSVDTQNGLVFLPTSTP
ncbi:MAG: PQQ-binding-like beta-propeller repeat protein, partial [Gammaproteobacteria bacterium]|nr:PQQ-binding-like beta-propeller repeat protein [Gammaproteobacteria bacterium]